MQLTTVVDIHKVKGQRPTFDVYIGQAVYNGAWPRPASKWHNPFPLSRYPINGMQRFEAYIRGKIGGNPEKYDLTELVGKRLGCWCVNQPWYSPGKCHGDVLVKLIKEKGLELNPS